MQFFWLSTTRFESVPIGTKKLVNFTLNANKYVATHCSLPKPIHCALFFKSVSSNIGARFEGYQRRDTEYNLNTKINYLTYVSMIKSLASGN